MKQNYLFLAMITFFNLSIAQTTETFSGGSNSTSSGNPGSMTFNTFDFTAETLSGLNAFLRDDSNGYAQFTGSRINSITIKLNAGGAFKLDQIVFETANTLTADDNITVTGYKSNSFVTGATSTFTVPGAIGTETTRDFTSITQFADVDEIRIAIADDGSFGGLRIESITTDTPTLSIDEISSTDKIKASLFPNPSTNFIQISGLIKKENYRIFGVLGAEIKNGIVSENEQIDIRSFTNGLYFLKFENGNTLKFLKD
tara:strand:+ start:87 stop:857 length:771 start_codon:yes stop_codon:yes gene_type:complete